MTVRVGVVVFPGSNCDTDTLRGLELAGAEPVALWHEVADLGGVAAVVLPGGFAYGDYLRTGVIARFSPVMGASRNSRRTGGPVLGICNGFQVLAEAGLVPGALLRNRNLQFLGRDVHVVAERLDTPFTRSLSGRRPLRLPIAHGEGCWYADDGRSPPSRPRVRSCSATSIPTDGRPGPIPRRTRTARSERSPACSRPVATWSA